MLQYFHRHVNFFLSMVKNYSRSVICHSKKKSYINFGQRSFVQADFRAIPSCTKYITDQTTARYLIRLQRGPCISVAKLSTHNMRPISPWHVTLLHHTVRLTNKIRQINDRWSFLIHKQWYIHVFTCIFILLISRYALMQLYSPIQNYMIYD